MRKFSKFLVVCILMVQAILILPSCEKEEVRTISDGGSGTIPSNVLLANEFVYGYSKDAYLWNDKIPSIDYKKEPDTKAMFEKIIYKEYDRWSYVSDDADSELDGFTGVYTSLGASYWIWAFKDSDEYFAVVKFVYKGGPADLAGLKRGDIIVTINNNNITEKNYLDLFYGSEVTFGLGKLEGDAIGDTGKSVKIVAKKIYEDPILFSKVIEKGDKKIGYLTYVGFYEESHNDLVKIFKDFKTKGVSDLVLDLRYNPGGNALTPPFLGALIAPYNKVKDKNIFLTQVWNKDYMDYYKNKKVDLNDYFADTIPADANLNLSRVYVLTTKGTASASEATISGLMPYMDVIKIGETTHGKYCGAALLQATKEDGKTLIPEIKNWLLSLVIYKFANVNGYTDFKDGIKPDYQVEDISVGAVPFGDETDPLLSKALSLITGKDLTKALNYNSKLVELNNKFERVSEPDNLRGGYVRKMRGEIIKMK